MADNQQQHSSPRSRRSVRFNLEQNTTCKSKKHGAEYSQDAEAYWYTNEKVQSMLMSTVRNAAAYRQLIVRLRSIHGRANQHRFVAGLLGEHGVICIQGIEHLVSSVSIRRNLIRMRQQVIRAVIEEQARHEVHSDNKHVLIATKSMKHSNGWRDRARKIGMYHERDAGKSSSI
ncbi:hypothetical protein QTG54_008498 [Skeletonema marinoi]|uniref:Uncharacterized protein n=1 Tax=Skeletonema marinoi TaxID=267567 RepID=A0AAD8Y736_9STRA|nr:hypothetical protein QTG54_008498 [Skeletonema marinoi]